MNHIYTWSMKKYFPFFFFSLFYLFTDWEILWVFHNEHSPNGRWCFFSYSCFTSLQIDSYIFFLQLTLPENYNWNIAFNVYHLEAGFALKHHNVNKLLYVNKQFNCQSIMCLMTQHVSEDHFRNIELHFHYRLWVL